MQRYIFNLETTKKATSTWKLPFNTFMYKQLFSPLREYYLHGIAAQTTK